MKKYIVILLYILLDTEVCSIYGHLRTYGVSGATGQLYYSWFLYAYFSNLWLLFTIAAEVNNV